MGTERIKWSEAGNGGRHSGWLRVNPSKEAISTRSGRMSDGGDCRQHAVEAASSVPSLTACAEPAPAQIPSADLDVPVLGQLPPTQFPLGYAIELGPMEVVGFDAPLGGGPFREQALEHAPRSVPRRSRPRTPRPGARRLWNDD
jgi:hypothetical protein